MTIVQLRLLYHVIVTYSKDYIADFVFIIFLKYLVVEHFTDYCLSRGEGQYNQ